MASSLRLLLMNSPVCHHEKRSDVVIQAMDEERFALE